RGLRLLPSVTMLMLSAGGVSTAKAIEDRLVRGLTSLWIGQQEAGEQRFLLDKRCVASICDKIGLSFRAVEVFSFFFLCMCVCVFIMISITERELRCLVFCF
ncbi:hypothetical protein PanWU01x14_194920, partial [Parasponia andersonii]